MFIQTARQEINPYSTLGKTQELQFHPPNPSSDRRLRRAARAEQFEQEQSKKAQIVIDDLMTSLERHGLKFKRHQKALAQERLSYFFRNGVKVHLEGEKSYQLDLQEIVPQVKTGNNPLSWVLLLMLALSNDKGLGGFIGAGYMPLSLGQSPPSRRRHHHHSRAYRL